MLSLPKHPVPAGLLAIGACALFCFVFVWGFAHLDDSSRTVRRWHANGHPRSLETCDLTGRAGLCLFWDELGRLDARASGIFGEFSRMRELSGEEVTQYSSARERSRLDFEALREALVTHAQAQRGRAPESLRELLRTGLFSSQLDGAHVIPNDAWGRGYEYAPEDREHPARLWTLGRDWKSGGEGEDEDQVCEFAGNGEPCYWSGTLQPAQ